MRRTKPNTVALACHPSSPTGAISGPDRERPRRWRRQARRALHARGGHGAGRAAEDAHAGRTDELWRHTCFEVFVGLPESEAYCELNFSPSGEWAMYGFVGYRRGMTPIEVRRPPRVAVRPTPRGMVLEAVTYLDELPSRNPGRRCVPGSRPSSRKRTDA